MSQRSHKGVRAAKAVLIVMLLGGTMVLSGCAVPPQLQQILTALGGAAARPAAPAAPGAPAAAAAARPPAAGAPAGVGALVNNTGNRTNVGGVQPRPPIVRPPAAQPQQQDIGNGLLWDRTLNNGAGGYRDRATGEQLTQPQAEALAISNGGAGAPPPPPAPPQQENIGNGLLWDRALNNGAGGYRNAATGDPLTQPEAEAVALSNQPPTPGTTEPGGADLNNGGNGFLPGPGAAEPGGADLNNGGNGFLPGPGATEPGGADLNNGGNGFLPGPGATEPGGADLNNGGNGFLPGPGATEPGGADLNNGGNGFVPGPGATEPGGADLAPPPEPVGDGPF
jgi:translation initiation factor IF-2